MKTKEKVFLLLSFILGLVFFGTINTYALEANVNVKDIELAEKSTYASIVSEPTYNKLNVNFDIRFSNINDYVKYKVTIFNEDSIDYNISTATGNEDEYVKYTYEFENNENIINGKSEKVMFITISYVKELPATVLNGNNPVYQMTSSKTIGLVNDGVSISSNPETGRLGVLGILLVNLIVLGGITAYVVIKKDKASVYIALIAITGLVPFNTKAIEGLSLSVTSKIQITEREGDKFYIYHSSSSNGEIKRYYLDDYKTGFDMTKEVSSGYVYGGYFEDFDGKGSYSGNGIPVSDGYEYTEGTDKWHGVYADSGKTLIPESGKTYFLKEIPVNYLKLETKYFTNNGRITNLYFISAIDDMNYKTIGFIVNDKVSSSIPRATLTLSSAEGEETTTYTVKDLFEGSLESGYVTNFDAKDMIKENASYNVKPFYITMDGVEVRSPFNYSLNLNDLSISGYSLIQN